MEWKDEAIRAEQGRRFLIDFDTIRKEVESWECSKVKEVQRLLLKGPPLFDIEVSSICNLECTFCPKNEIFRDNEIMDMNKFKVLSKWLPDDAIVMFSGLGECLLNRHLEEMIHLLKVRGISSCIVTNGILLDSSRQRSLIKAGIDQIQISYIASNKETYRRAIHRNGSYETLRNNLKYLSNNRPKGLRVQLNFVDLGYNSNEISGIQETANEWGFQFHYRRLHSRGGAITLTNAKSSIEPSCFRCGTFASVYYITSDGEFIPCSNDVNKKHVMGSLGKLTFNELVFMRKDIIDNGYSFNICSKCSDDYRWVILKIPIIPSRPSPPKYQNPG